MAQASEILQNDAQPQLYAPSAEQSLPNTLAQLRTRVAQGRLSYLGPLVLVMGRSALMLLAQGLFAIIFFLRGVEHPWLAAAPWWTVYGTLIDIGCLTLMWRFTSAEGIRLRDLIGPIKLRHAHDFFLGLGILLVVFPLFVGGGLLSSRLVYGAYQVNVFPGILAGRVLPLWATVYSCSLWWMIWSVTEEMTYAGYVLPRIQALSGRTWMAIVLVGFWWSVQHSFLPFIPEWRNFVWRSLAFVPGTVAFSLIYLRTRRLTPLIFAHWAMDIVGNVMTTRW